MNKLVVSFIVVSTCFFASVSAKDVLVSSPDGTVTVAVGVKTGKPYPMTIRQEMVSSLSTLHLRLARSGGAAVRIERIAKP